MAYSERAIKQYYDAIVQYRKVYPGPISDGSMTNQFYYGELASCGPWAFEVWLRKYPHFKAWVSQHYPSFLSLLDLSKPLK